MSCLDRRNLGVQLTPLADTCLSISSHLSPFHSLRINSPLGILPPALPKVASRGLALLGPGVPFGLELRDVGVSEPVELGLKCWNRAVSLRLDSLRRLKAACSNLLSRRYCRPISNQPADRKLRDPTAASAQGESK